MNVKDAYERFSPLTFAQKFLAFVLLVQVSSIFVGLVMRILTEFGCINAAIYFYIAFLVLGLVLFFILQFSMRGRAGSYFIGAILYCLFAIAIMYLVSTTTGEILSLFVVINSILAAWGFANVIFSIVILIFSLLRLIFLGLAKDYERPPKAAIHSSLADLREEIEQLKQERKEQEKKDQ